MGLYVMAAVLLVAAIWVLVKMKGKPPMWAEDHDEHSDHDLWVDGVDVTRSAVIDPEGTQPTLTVALLLRCGCVLRFPLAKEHTMQVMMALSAKGAEQWPEAFEHRTRDDDK